MSTPRLRSFQGRIFLAILAVMIVPVTVAGLVGLFTLQGIGTRSGTLGAWDAVAESGVELLDALDEADLDDPAVSQAARSHREALSESVRLSRLYAFVAERFLTFLPIAALLTGVLVVGTALVTAGWLSRGFGAPIRELARWTTLISSGEPLPSVSPTEERDLAEVRMLRGALRSMAAELTVARERAVEAARMRSWTELARRVAHELKNPLTPMRLAAETLGRHAKGAEAAAAAVLTEEIARLDGMARSFARYGRMPEGPRSRVDLGELARALADQHGSENVSVTVEDGGAVVFGQYDALERAVRNLVVNAVEASKASDATSRRVDIRVDTESAEAVVRVRDGGSGIPMDLQKEIWNPEVSTKRTGTGLGLAIVRQTVLHHDGSVSASNHPEGGALFTIRLPVEVSEDAGAPANNSPGK